MIELTESQASLARYYVAEAVRRRRLTGQPLQVAAVSRLLAALADQTASGHGTSSATSRAEQSEPDDLIGIVEAAALIGCTPRHCRRLAHQLDGIRVGTRSWVFNRHTVTNYAEGKHHAAQPE